MAALTGGASGLFISDAVVIDGFEQSGNLSVDGGISVNGGVAGLAYSDSISVYEGKLGGQVNVAAKDIDIEQMMTP